MAFVGPVELCVIFDNKDNHSTHEQNFAPAASLSCPAIDGASSTSGHFPLRNGLHRNRGHARPEKRRSEENYRTNRRNKTIISIQPPQNFSIMKAKRLLILTAIICMASLFSVDLAYAYHPVSPYAYCNGNPVRYVDPDGKQIVGVTRNDAANAIEDLRQMFQGEQFAAFRNLIVQSGKKGNGKSLASISNEALEVAFNGISLNEDQQALVNMAVNTINSSDKHIVEYVSEGVISGQGQNAFSGEFSNAGLPMGDIIAANGGIPVAIIANFGGGGLTVPTQNGSHSVIVGNNHPNGRAVTTGHEVIGHGRSLAVGRGQANQHIDAVRTENLILRVMGINYINNGSTHGPRIIIPAPSALPRFR